MVELTKARAAGNPHWLYALKSWLVLPALLVVCIAIGLVGGFFNYGGKLAELRQGVVDERAELAQCGKVHPQYMAFLQARYKDPKPALDGDIEARRHVPVLQEPAEKWDPYLTTLAVYRQHEADVRAHPGSPAYTDTYATMLLADETAPQDVRDKVLREFNVSRGADYSEDCAGYGRVFLHYLGKTEGVVFDAAVSEASGLATALFLFIGVFYGAAKAFFSPGDVGIKRAGLVVAAALAPVFGWLMTISSYTFTLFQLSIWSIVTSALAFVGLILAVVVVKWVRKGFDQDKTRS